MCFRFKFVRMLLADTKLGLYWACPTIFVVVDADMLRRKTWNENLFCSNMDNLNYCDPNMMHLQNVLLDSSITNK